MREIQLPLADYLCVKPLATTAGAAATHAEEPHIARESIEWCNIWIPDANGTKLPRVLLIGDSITQGYYPQVADKLKGKASVARLTTSKSIGDPALLAEVALVLDQCRFDVVHFNNGLHGWGYSEAEYEKHFPELVATIRKHAPKAKLIWATTTPMRKPENLAVIAEGTKRVQARNKIAAGDRDQGGDCRGRSLRPGEGPSRILVAGRRPLQRQGDCRPGGAGDEADHGEPQVGRRGVYSLRKPSSRSR